MGNGRNGLGQFFSFLLFCMWLRFMSDKQARPKKPAVRYPPMLLLFVLIANFVASLTFLFLFSRLMQPRGRVPYGLVGSSGLTGFVSEGIRAWQVFQSMTGSVCRQYASKVGVASRAGRQWFKRAGWDGSLFLRPSYSLLFSCLALTCLVLLRPCRPAMRVM